jgi:hypothetical protein
MYKNTCWDFDRNCLTYRSLWGELTLFHSELSIHGLRVSFHFIQICDLFHLVFFIIINFQHTTVGR